MKETLCPRCTSDRLVHGRYFNPHAVMGQQTGAPRFRPDGLKKFMLLDPSVAIRGRETFAACLDCGLLWSHIDREKLLKSIRKNGAEATVQRCVGPAEPEEPS